ncbi:DNA-3-methyladenine glycosylase 2 family protein [Kushneria aurantia]|uniref:DNA-3-methyladenine glycosylase II n=1 Tax=Kushneria aurantia TaxID=504092 RepID=A0ABV6FZ24_9GAMM|nr:Ada metal-binding domain-containing protein [Kushneria aurantia]
MTTPDTDSSLRYRACLARDARFDGRFVVGVATTGIYCRPVCPARKPRAENCRFFDHPAQAEQAGFRPCLRCRPERAAAVIGRLPSGDLNGQLAEAAAQAIDQGALERGSLVELARHIGVSPRHLRRLFQRVYGVSPQAWALTQRLLTARRLLADTPLPITEVAALAGFGSLRRFNALFLKRYGIPPSRLRRESPASRGATTMTLQASYRPPLAWSALRDFLGRRAITGVERLTDDQGYARVIRHPDGSLGWLNTAPAAQGYALHLTLPAHQAARSLDYLRLAHRLFDLDARIDLIDAHLSTLTSTAGIRVPGGADGFEVAVRTVVGQVISLEHARTLLARLVQAHGDALEDPAAPAGLSHAFPTATRLAGVAADALTELGLTRMKARAICHLARAVSDGALRLTPEAPLDATLSALQAIPGIGDWSAQMVAMRALDWPDAWPAGDLVLRRCVDALGPATDPADWSPWRAYAAMRLWHRATEPTPVSTHCAAETRS